MMNASTIVARLLETEDVDVEHYMSKVNTGSVEEVLAALGFKDLKLNVPLRHTHFPTKFGKPEPQDVHFIEVRVGPCSLPNTGDPKVDIFHRDDRDAISYKMQVSFHPEHFYISSSRDCIATGEGKSGRGSLGARLNHVIRFLLDAIHTADAQKHTDLWEFFNDIDKRWGRQSNRWIVRKKK